MFTPAILLAVGLGFVCTASATYQQTFNSQGGASGFDSYDAGLFAPLEDLGLLSTSEFMTLGHPAFPDYNVRIKKSDFCDGTVR